MTALFSLPDKFHAAQANPAAIANQGRNLPDVGRITDT
jgi:hypothetical protein